MTRLSIVVPAGLKDAIKKVARRDSRTASNWAATKLAELAGFDPDAVQAEEAKDPDRELRKQINREAHAERRRERRMRVAKKRFAKGQLSVIDGKPAAPGPVLPIHTDPQIEDHARTDSPQSSTKLASRSAAKQKEGTA